MKRFISLFLAVMILTLAGCGTKRAVENNTDNAEIITMYVPGATQPDQELVQKEWNSHLKKTLNVNLNIKVIPWGDWDNKKSTALSVNEDVDILWTDGNSYYSEIAKSAFAPLDELIDNYGKDLKSVINPLYLKGAKVDGQLYMVPTNKEMAIARAMWFRTDLLKKYNLKVTKDMTIEDFGPLYKTIKENEPDMTPADIQIAWYGVTKGMKEHEKDFSPVPGCEYLYLENSTGKVYSIFDLDWITSRYQIYKNYKDSGYFSDAVIENKITPIENIKNGKQFSFTGMNKPYEAEANKGRYNLSENPTMASALTPTIDTISATGAGLAIVSYSKKKELAMKVINALWTDEKLINLVQSGIEGKHYIKNNNSKFWKTLPQGAKSESDTGYSPIFFWQFGNEMLNLYWDTEPVDKHEKFEQFNNDGYISPLFGFCFTTENIKTEVTSISNVYTTYSDMLNLAKMDDVAKTLEEARSKMKVAGIDKVIKEVEKQYAEWKAKN